MTRPLLRAFAIAAIGLALAAAVLGLWLHEGRPGPVLYVGGPILTVDAENFANMLSVVVR